MRRIYASGRILHLIGRASRKDDNDYTDYHKRGENDAEYLRQSLFYTLFYHYICLSMLCVLNIISLMRCSVNRKISFERRLVLSRRYAEMRAECLYEIALARKAAGVCDRRRARRPCPACSGSDMSPFSLHPGGAGQYHDRSSRHILSTAGA